VYAVTCVLYGIIFPQTNIYGKKRYCYDIPEKARVLDFIPTKDMRWKDLYAKYYSNFNKFRITLSIVPFELNGPTVGTKVLVNFFIDGKQLNSLLEAPEGGVYSSLTYDPVSLQYHLEALTSNFNSGATLIRFGVLGLDNIKICALVSQNDRTITWTMDKGCKKYNFERKKYILTFTDIIKSLLILTQKSAIRYQRTLFCDDLELLSDTIAPSSLVKRYKKKTKKTDKLEKIDGTVNEGVAEKERAKQNKLTIKDKRKLTSFRRKAQQAFKMKLKFEQCLQGYDMDNNN